MTQFKTGDRVKVVRESVSDPDFNRGLADAMDCAGIITEIDDSDNVHTVMADGDSTPWFIPADMLELEVTK